MSTARTTQKDLDAVLENLNRRLPRHVRVESQGRNGYSALDEYREVEDENHGTHFTYKWIMSRTLFAGTKKECYDACWHMIRGIDLSRDTN